MITVRRVRRNFCLLFSIAAAVASQHFAASATEKKVQARQLKQERVQVLNFPTQYSIGFLYSLPSIETPSEHSRPIGPAKGTVKLSESVILKFEPNHNFFLHPELILRLPTNAIDSISLRFTSMNSAEEKLSDHVASYLPHLKSLQNIDFSASDTSDKGVTKLSGMPKLKLLNCNDSMVTGTCLRDLRQCKSIEFLRISGSRNISNRDLQYLQDFPRLSRLNVNRSGVTREGLEHVSQCKKLEFLDVALNPQIRDDCVPILARMRSLKALDLHGTGISYQGVLKLKPLGRRLDLRLPRSLKQYNPREQLILSQLFAIRPEDLGKQRQSDALTREFDGMFMTKPGAGH